MMFLFLRLILAHFLADFPLQPDIIYKLKIKNLWGQFLHALIFVVCAVGLSWPFLGIKAIWGLFLFLGASHFAIDCLKVRYVDKGRAKIWSFLADQLLHLGAVSIIFLTGLKDLSFSANPCFLERLYANNFLILFLIILIISAYVIKRMKILRGSQ
ncbi:MAG: DUF3307 domain-containing protein [Candidatus Omnitrophota bacterium]|nr:DUF3307 domain-containing protein [Candidatus Omnitrophota bacterium]